MNVWKKVPSIALSVALIAALRLSAADAPGSFKVGEFTFKPPAGWESIPSSGMRKAQFQFPADKKNGQAEVVFFHFGPGDGGGVQANFERWLGQFQEGRDRINAKTDEVTVKGRKVHYVQADGTYLSGMPGGPKTPLPNHMLLGAILESAQGSVFIRCTGPIEVVKAGRKTFREMAEGALK